MANTESAPKEKQLESEVLSFDNHAERREFMRNAIGLFREVYSLRTAMGYEKHSSGRKNSEVDGNFAFKMRYVKLKHLMKKIEADVAQGNAVEDDDVEAAQTHYQYLIEYRDRVEQAAKAVGIEMTETESTQPDDDRAQSSENEPTSTVETVQSETKAEDADKALVEAFVTWRDATISQNGPDREELMEVLHEHPDLMNGKEMSQTEIAVIRNTFGERLGFSNQPTEASQPDTRSPESDPTTPVDADSSESVKETKQPRKPTRKERNARYSKQHRDRVRLVKAEPAAQADRIERDEVAALHAYEQFSPEELEEMHRSNQRIANAEQENSVQSTETTRSESIAAVLQKAEQAQYTGVDDPDYAELVRLHEQLKKLESRLSSLEEWENDPGIVAIQKTNLETRQRELRAEVTPVLKRVSTNITKHVEEFQKSFGELAALRDEMVEDEATATKERKTGWWQRDYPNQVTTETSAIDASSTGRSSNERNSDNSEVGMSTEKVDTNAESVSYETAVQNWLESKRALKQAEKIYFIDSKEILLDANTKLQDKQFAHSHAGIALRARMGELETVYKKAKQEYAVALQSVLQERQAKNQAAETTSEVFNNPTRTRAIMAARFFGQPGDEGYRSKENQSRVENANQSSWDADRAADGSEITIGPRDTRSYAEREALFLQETLPAKKKNMFNKMWNRYTGLTPWKRYAIGGGIAGVVGVASGLSAAQWAVRYASGAIGGAALGTAAGTGTRFALDKTLVRWAKHKAEGTRTEALSNFDAQNFSALEAGILRSRKRADQSESVRDGAAMGAAIGAGFLAGREINDAVTDFSAPDISLPEVHTTNPEQPVQPQASDVAPTSVDGEPVTPVAPQPAEMTPEVSPDAGRRPAVPPSVEIPNYTAEAGDNLWDIVEGQTNAEQPPAFTEVDVSRQDDLIDLTRDYINELSQSERYELGFGDTASDLDIGATVNLEKIDDIARQIATEQGWL